MSIPKVIAKAIADANRARLRAEGSAEEAKGGKFLERLDENRKGLRVEGFEERHALRDSADAHYGAARAKRDSALKLGGRIGLKSVGRRG